MQFPVAVNWSTEAVTLPFASTVVCTTPRTVKLGALPCSKASRTTWATRLHKAGWPVASGLIEGVRRAAQGPAVAGGCDTRTSRNN